MMTTAASECSTDDLRAFAQTIPALARAAGEGYEIVSAVMMHIAESVARAGKTIEFGGGMPPRIVSEGWPEFNGMKWEERKAPHATAFDCLDHVRAHVATIQKPPSVDIEVLRIQRFSTTGGRQRQQYTSVIVKISSLAAKTYWVVFAAEGGR